ncbi:HDOD domain-containing protein [Pelagicoccus sp. SDUM812002]|uniref:HDOD domain-containing protein n=1 Tax=Pelagicoccus sp. SDUM812002 TaxID=3041266 RepID=UPI00280D86C2|nr:HDOD domain-containing protein [Pelagicoccus sp. SDUM812002]MDQ8188032.1 HDOD domain-containing protein [Pelagicoccus sp. SDUM812002]
MNQKIEYRNYLEDVQGLFPMPRILAEIARLLKDDDTTIDDLAELLMTDPTLVAELTKLSNSSYFGFAEKSDSLSEAMQRIGMREIARLVGVCTAGEVYQAELRHYRIPPDVFWESGIAAALLMEALAEKTNKDSESAYLAGMMRESGMLVIDYALSREGVEVLWDAYVPVQKWERDCCGHDHMEVGAALLEVWGFSKAVCEAVAEQWEEGNQREGLSALLNFTNRVLARTGCEFNTPIEPFSDFAEAAEALGLSEEAVAIAIDRAKGTSARLRGGVLEK